VVIPLADIEMLREICRERKTEFTLHALERMRERKFPASMIINTVMSGEIIRQYEDDKPFPSCLIFNNDMDKPLHVVVSTDGKSVYIITVYSPSPSEWEDGFKTRRERK
jgi:hypothetical protein